VSTARSSPLWPTAASKVVGVIGDPVSHSLSPRLHNAAFDAMGLDWVSVAFRVSTGEVPGALAGMRSLEIAGLSVTTPHKDAAAAVVDELTPVAARLGATNCVTLRDGKLVGDSTDGEGFVRALREGSGFEPEGRTCAVLGAGAAARAVSLALAEAGAGEVLVVNRTRSRAQAVAVVVGDVGRVGNAADVSGADLVVQATSVGLLAAGEGPRDTPIDPEVLRRGQLVAELVYDPPVTPFLSAAADRGARTFGGLGMLVHQASIAIERWTGLEAPVAEMWRAASRSGR
jgi:shikimate dehydrogenase